MLFKNKKTPFGCFYEAPECEVAVCPADGICSDSVDSTTDDYNDGGDFTW